MTRTRKGRTARDDGEPGTPQLPQPVNVADGIPDRCERPRRCRYLLIAAIFLLWLAFLVYCAAAGNV